ncbi:MAG: inverse autotransporter beta domain-containing protein, partial [bacterium]|nr:inverse autotransporter beta domain-containing protein [bacterium]
MLQLSLNLSTDYQNKSRSFLFFDGFLPFSGDNNNIWFADVRFLNREQRASEGNLGLGYRHELDSHPWIAGAYGFVDRRRSFDKNFFSTLTLGGELKGVDWSLGTNLYVPVGQSVKSAPSALNAILRPTTSAGIYNIYYNQGREAALTGFDVEAGHSIAKIPGLTAYIGGYGYPSAHQVSSRVGPLVRAEYNLSDSGLLGQHPLMDSTVIEGFMRHDSFIGTSYYVGLKFGLNLDGTPRYAMDPLHRRMIDPVWRDIDVITANDAKKTPILDVKANGTPVTVAIANNLSDLKNYLSQGIDVVGVNGTINTTPAPLLTKTNSFIAPQNAVLSL